MTKKRILIAGGGTGGHIAPAIAVGRRATGDFHVSYACTPRPVDEIMYSKVTNPVHILNPPRLDKGMKFLLPFSAAKSLYKAIQLLRSNSIDGVLGTGGYSSFFTILAAWLSRIPAALFESNAIPGRSNRFASRFCRYAFAGLPGGCSGLRAGIVNRTGTPVSDRLMHIPVEEARAKLNLPEGKPVVLCLGGSQGATAINNIALALPANCSVLLQCGDRDYSRVSKLAAERPNMIIEPFIDDLSMWYSAAELAVARAGGQTIAELSSFNLPALLIPFPFAADDHQTANAAVVEKAGAAILMKQENTSPQQLSEILHRLISQPDEIQRMRIAMSSLFPEDSVGRIVGYLKEMVL